MKTDLKVTLLSYPKNADQLVASAAKLCYSSKDIQQIVNDNSDVETVGKFLDMLSESGHGSPFEHINFTFGIEGISRALSHQLVRHRIASYSQKSQRYVNESNFDYVIPHDIEVNDEAQHLFEKTMENIQKSYDELVALGVAKESARYVLPNACETKIVMTMNARSLFNFFNHRCCLRAQTEIREMAYAMLKEVKKVAPETFKNAGAHCKSLGYCPEGKMSCGLFPTLDYIKQMKK